MTTNNAFDGIVDKILAPVRVALLREVQQMHSGIVANVKRSFDTGISAPLGALPPDNAPPVTKTRRRTRRVATASVPKADLETRVLSACGKPTAKKGIYSALRGVSHAKIDRVVLALADGGRLQRGGTGRMTTYQTIGALGTHAVN